MTRASEKVKAKPKMEREMGPGSAVLLAPPRWPMTKREWELRTRFLRALEKRAPISR